MTDDAETVWSRPERGKRGPAPERNRTQIAAVAIALADADGLEAVSMRQIAARLGTGPASLYRYLGSRDELIDLMADAVTGEIELDSAVEQDWAGALITLATATKGAYLAHPWMLDVLTWRTPIGPRALDWWEYALALIEPAGAEAQVQLEAIALLNGLVSLFARHEVQARRSADPQGEVQVVQLGHMADAGLHPRLAAALADSPREIEPDARFVRVLRSVLDSLTQPRL